MLIDIIHCIIHSLNTPKLVWFQRAYAETVVRSIPEIIVRIRCIKCGDEIAIHFADFRVIHLFSFRWRTLHRDNSVVGYVNYLSWLRMHRLYPSSSLLVAFVTASSEALTFYLEVNDILFGVTWIDFNSAVQPNSRFCALVDFCA